MRKLLLTLQRALTLLYAYLTIDLTRTLLHNLQHIKNYKIPYSSSFQPRVCKKLARSPRVHWNLTKLISPVHMYSFEITFLMVLECNML